MTRANSPWYYKWVVLSCAFLNYVLIDGVRFSFGVLYVELLDAFRAGKSETAWIGSVQIGIFNLAGVIAGSIARRYGLVNTIVIGTLLSAVGICSTSFATSIYVMYVTFGLIPGLGFSMMGLSSVVAVNQNFDKQQSLAMGICQAGGSVGGFVFNPLLQVFIDIYGWRGALLLISAILLHGVLFGILINTFGLKNVAYTMKTDNEHSENYENCAQTKDLIFKDNFHIDSFGSITLTINSSNGKACSKDVKSFDLRPNSAENTPTDSNQEENGLITLKYMDDTTQETEILENNSNVKTHHKRKQNKCLSVFNKIVPYHVLGDRATFIFLFSAFIRSFGFFVPFVLLPDLAVENQIRIEKAAWLASAMGITGAISRVLLGWIGDFKRVDRIYLYTFCLLGSGISSAVCPSLSLYGLLMIYACIFGTLMGGECCLTPVICSDVAGRDTLADTYGMLQTLCGIGATCGTPFSGWLFEVTKSYSVSFIMAGALITVSGVLLMPLKCKCIINKQMQA